MRPVSVLVAGSRSSRRRAVPTSPERASSAASMSMAPLAQPGREAATVDPFRPQSGEGRRTLACRLAAQRQQPRGRQLDVRLGRHGLHLRDPVEPFVGVLGDPTVEGHPGHREIGACHLWRLHQPGRRRGRDDGACGCLGGVQLPPRTSEQSVIGHRIEFRGDAVVQLDVRGGGEMTLGGRQVTGPVGGGPEVAVDEDRNHLRTHHVQRGERTGLDGHPLEHGNRRRPVPR